METKEYFEMEMFFESLRLPLDKISAALGNLKANFHCAHLQNL